MEPLERPERWKPRRQSGRLDLVEMDSLRQVAQTVKTQIEQRCVRHEPDRRSRGQDLPAVTDVQDASERLSVGPK